MELSAQVCSLSLSKELKKANYPQEGLWWWALCADSASASFNTPGTMHLMMVNGIWNKDSRVERYVASTVAELGKMMKEVRYTYITNIEPSSGEFILEVYDELKRKSLTSVFADTEANARAKMWLYLKKSNLLPFKERSER